MGAQCLLGAVYAASMGPQLYRCGNNTTDTVHVRCYESFNGAATLSLRKPGKSRKQSEQGIPASMGPQLYRCGNLHKELLVLANGYASMGPQLYRCGNSITASNIVFPFDWLQWGRNFIVAETQNTQRKIKLAMSLQWGRNFIVAETQNTQRKIKLAMSLQWGRNFIVAETGAFVLDTLKSCLASMGPQLYRCGNQERRRQRPS